MDSQIEKLREKMQSVQAALGEEIERRRKSFRYSVTGRRVEFEDEVRKAHRAARESLGSFLSRTRPLVVLTAPVIYSLIIPFVILDLFVTLYQAICFPVYGIAKVRRADHIAVDRGQLQYLNALQKLNCMYCGYGNGLISYVREIAARTEAYWCPIKHARRLRGTHDHYPAFADYGDGTDYQAHVEAMRRAVSAVEDAD